MTVRSCFWSMCLVYGYHSGRTVRIKNVQNVYIHNTTENFRNRRCGEVEKTMRERTNKLCHGNIMHT